MKKEKINKDLLRELIEDYRYIFGGDFDITSSDYEEFMYYKQRTRYVLRMLYDFCKPIMAKAIRENRFPGSNDYELHHVCLKALDRAIFEYNLLDRIKLDRFAYDYYVDAIGVVRERYNSDKLNGKSTFELLLNKDNIFDVKKLEKN